ncbi:MAG: hypothetical protein IT473_14135 [Lysobacter sp.]|nr:hypothetical protein [Lysobacter sp.]
MGQFVAFYLPYIDQNGNKSASSHQAAAIVAEAQARIDAGSPGVAITYSANYGQTVAIHAAYDGGGWNTKTSGANQADVMREMESLLGGQNASLQRKLEIAPITTMTYSDYGGRTQDQVVQADLDYIKALLDKGWTVLGWQNQDSAPKGRYAVGGGVAGGLPQAIDTLIQTTLTQYASKYP